MKKRCAGRGVEREIRVHSARGEIHMIHDGGAVLREEEVDIVAAHRPTQISGEATAVFSAGREPQPLGSLETNARVKGISLVLGNGELARVRYAGSIIAQKEPSGDGALADSDLIRVADETGKTAPSRDGELNFLAVNLSRGKGNGETHAGIEQRIVVRIVVKVAKEYVSFDAEYSGKGFCESRFVIIRRRGLDGEPDHQVTHRIELRRAGQQ